MDGDKKTEKEQKKREKEEQKQREREEKARLKEKRKELKEARKKEKREALEEMQELPELEAEKEATALYCGPEVEECVAVEGEAAPAEEGMAGPATEPAAQYTTAPTPADTPQETTLEAKEESAEEEEGITPEEEKERWLTRLRRGLSKSRVNLVAPLSRVMASRRFDDEFWGEVEDILVGADVGMEMTMIDRRHGPTPRTTWEGRPGKESGPGRGAPRLLP